MTEWTEGLNEEDFDFIKRFLLASGSLKDVARQYGISYPTMRQRIDRLIEKIKLYDGEAGMSAFEKVVRTKWVEGKIDGETMRSILEAHRQAAGEGTRPVGRADERAVAEGVSGVDVD